MRFPDHLLDEIRARLAVSQVVGRRVALKKAGREYRGLSPFKSERTPSFFVNDQKGFYHCFASGEHGDIFTFVMKTEGLSFTEAVERLAGEAGIALPKADASASAADARRVRLYTLLEAAASFFEAQLAAAAGTEARRYVLETRQLKRETVAAFRIGFAPNSRTALAEHLRSAGFSRDEMVTAGMLIAGDDIREPYDRFRNRVMFPITDLKGRVIAFGGRALEKGAPAKYLNSPETPLFHKGRVLFNAARARPLAFARGRLLVAEGYMDVVALTEAGFGEAVAPLGTALTEDQIEVLWRLTPEPTLCFDGDSAGRKAAFRAVDTVLPLLRPGFSLSFAFLPDGLDPDDLVRARGSEAMGALIDARKPLAEVLLDKEVISGDGSTPERRAALEAALAAQVRRIREPTVRAHYGDTMRQRLSMVWGRPVAATRLSALDDAALEVPPETRASRASMGPANAGPPRDRGPRAARPTTAGASPHAAHRPIFPGAAAPVYGGRMGRPGPAAARAGRPGAGRADGRSGRWLEGPDPRTARSSSLVASRLVAPSESATPTREMLILAGVLRHPWLLDEHAEMLAALELQCADMRQVRDAVLTVLAIAQGAADTDTFTLDSRSLATQLGRLGVSSVLSQIDRCATHCGDRFATASADRATVIAGWLDAVRLHRRASELVRALRLAEQAFVASQQQEDLDRIVELQRELTAAADQGADCSLQD